MNLTHMQWPCVCFAYGLFGSTTSYEKAIVSYVLWKRCKLFH
jgi:hypothetical protein